MGNDTSKSSTHGAAVVIQTPTTSTHGTVDVTGHPPEHETNVKDAENITMEQIIDIGKQKVAETPIADHIAGTIESETVEDGKSDGQNNGNIVSQEREPTQSLDNRENVHNTDLIQEIIHSPENQEIVQHPDNQEIVHNPINQEIVHNPINQEIVHNPENQEIVHNPINQEITHNPDNQEIILNPVNQELVHNPDIQEILHNPENQEIVHNPENQEMSERKKPKKRSFFGIERPILRDKKNKSKDGTRGSKVTSITEDDSRVKSMTEVKVVNGHHGDGEIDENLTPPELPVKINKHIVDKNEKKKKEAEEKKRLKEEKKRMKEEEKRFKEEKKRSKKGKKASVENPVEERKEYLEEVTIGENQLCVCPGMQESELQNAEIAPESIELEKIGVTETEQCEDDKNNDQICDNSEGLVNGESLSETRDHENEKETSVNNSIDMHTDETYISSDGAVKEVGQTFEICEKVEQIMVENTPNEQSSENNEDRTSETDTERHDKHLLMVEEDVITIEDVTDFTQAGMAAGEKTVESDQSVPDISTKQKLEDVTTVDQEVPETMDEVPTPATNKAVQSKPDVAVEEQITECIDVVQKVPEQVTEQISEEKRDIVRSVPDVLTDRVSETDHVSETDRVSETDHVSENTVDVAAPTVSENVTALVTEQDSDTVLTISETVTQETPEETSSIPTTTLSEISTEDEKKLQDSEAKAVDSGNLDHEEINVSVTENEESVSLDKNGIENLPEYNDLTENEVVKDSDIEQTFETETKTNVLKETLPPEAPEVIQVSQTEVSQTDMELTRDKDIQNGLNVNENENVTENFVSEESANTISTDAEHQPLEHYEPCENEIVLVQKSSPDSKKKNKKDKSKDSKKKKEKEKSKQKSRISSESSHDSVSVTSSSHSDKIDSSPKSKNKKDKLKKKSPKGKLIDNDNESITTSECLSNVSDPDHSGVDRHINGDDPCVHVKTAVGKTASSDSNEKKKGTSKPFSWKALTKSSKSDEEKDKKKKNRLSGVGNSAVNSKESETDKAINRRSIFDEEIHIELDDNHDIVSLSSLESEADSECTSVSESAVIDHTVEDLVTKETQNNSDSKHDTARMGQISSDNTEHYTPTVLVVDYDTSKSENMESGEESLKDISLTSVESEISEKHDVSDIERKVKFSEDKEKDPVYLVTSKAVVAEQDSKDIYPIEQSAIRICIKVESQYVDTVAHKADVQTVGTQTDYLSSFKNPSRSVNFRKANKEEMDKTENDNTVKATHRSHHGFSHKYTLPLVVKTGSGNRNVSDSRKGKKLVFRRQNSDKHDSGNVATSGCSLTKPISFKYKEPKFEEDSTISFTKYQINPKGPESHESSKVTIEKGDSGEDKKPKPESMSI